MSSIENRYFNSYKKPKTGKGIRNDYHRKNLQSPFQRHRTNVRQAEMSKKFKLTLALVIAFIITFIWFIFWSNVFTIKNIEIVGLERANSDEIKALAQEKTNNRRCLIFSQHNLLMFKKSDLANDLKDKYNFAEVKISKKLFNKLKIEVRERGYAYVWGEEGKYYHVDENTYLIDEIPLDRPIVPILISSSSPATSTATSTEIVATSTVEVDDNNLMAQVKKISVDYPIIKNEGAPKLDEKKIDLDKNYFDFIKRLSDKFKNNNDPELMINYFLVGSEFNTIKVNLSSGLTIFFNTTEDWDKQMDNIFLLKKELKSDFNKLIKQKIDLRYGDKVYYE